MRHVLSPLLILAVAASIVTSAAGQWDRRNAATWYRKVVEQFGWEYETNGTYPDSVRLLTFEEEDVLDAYRDNPSGDPSAEVRRVLAKAGPMMEYIRRGSQERYSDFQLDYSQGFGLVLPHLSSLRKAARVMQADALVRMHDGDIAGAIDRVASLYRMSGHVGSDRIIISSLVGQSVFALSDKMTQHAIDRGDLSAFESAILVNSLKTLDERDPFNYIEAVAGEQVIAVDWMAQRFATQEDRQAFAEEVGWIFGDEAARLFTEISDDEFATQIELYDQFMGRAVEAFMLEDPEEGKAALAQLWEQAEAGEFGLLPLGLAPEFSRILDQGHESRAAVAGRLAELEKLAQGELKPQEYANAAVFYERGIRLMREIDARRLQAVLDYQNGDADELTEALLQTLTDAQGVVDLFREGSEKRRCDFAYLRPSSTDQFCPDYLAGVRDALRVILADAMRLLDAGEQDAAVVDRLVICYRAVAHMTSDELLLSAMIAHDTFKEAHSLGKRMAAGGQLTDEQQQSLLKAVERIGRKDPFGYINSIMATRDRLSKGVRSLPGKADAEEGHPTRERAIEAVKILTGDQLLTLTAARDTVLQAAAEGRKAKMAASATPPAAAEPQESEQKSHPLTRMDGIIDFEALVEVRDEAKAIDDLFNAGRVDEIFSTSAFPRVAPVLKWMSRARADLRDCIIRLRPPMADPPIPPGSPD